MQDTLTVMTPCLVQITQLLVLCIDENQLLAIERHDLISLTFNGIIQ